MPDASPGLECPHCHYNLAGSPSVDAHLVCPECGKKFTRDPGALQLPFAPVVVAGVFVPIALWLAVVLLEPLRRDWLVTLPILGVLLTPAVFASVASRRWANPMRRSVLVKYFVAVTIRDVVTSLCTLLLIRLLLLSLR
jgi:hypothetical protein